MIKSAEISECGKYRYQLKRQWGGGNNFVLFVGLNPSVADAEIDDPTLTRCINFAKSQNYDGLIINNLFAYRATNPDDLIGEKDYLVGALNDDWIKRSLAEVNAIVVCWGNDGVYLNRNEEVLKILKEHQGSKPVFCLDKNSTGQPKHPLYAKGDKEWVEFNLSV